MQFTAENILERMKTELKNTDSRIEGNFSMDNLQAVAEELARFNAMLIVPLQDEIENKKDELYTSGNERHYEQWAKEVIDGDGNKVIANARAHGVRDGSGIVYLALISVAAGAPTDEEVELVKQYIEIRRPVGAKPIITAAEGVDITIRGAVSLKESYDINIVKSIAAVKIREYFAENAFQKSQAALNYYRIGIILGNIEGVRDVLDYTINDARDSIPADYDEYFTLEELVLDGG